MMKDTMAEWRLPTWSVASTTTKPVRQTRCPKSAAPTSAREGDAPRLSGKKKKKKRGSGRLEAQSHQTHPKGGRRQRPSKSFGCWQTSTRVTQGAPTLLALLFLRPRPSRPAETRRPNFSAQDKKMEAVNNVQRAAAFFIRGGQGAALLGAFYSN